MNTAKTMVNVSPKMSNREAIERELEKFVKMFSTKAVQAIVQSRLGDKMQTFSNPRSLSNDWVSQDFSQTNSSKQLQQQDEENVVRITFISEMTFNSIGLSSFSVVLFQSIWINLKKRNTIEKLSN